MRIRGLLCNIVSALLAALCIPPCSSQTFVYDAEGRLIRAVYPQGGGVRYQYDSADNLLAVAPLSVPPAPAGVQVSPGGTNSFRISWDATAGATGYRVERRLADGSTWETIATLPASQRSFVDQGLMPGREYVYRISALGADGNGAYSDSVSTASSAGAPPLISRDGIVNGASFDPNQPIAPGSIISIFGENFGYNVVNGQRSLLNAVAGGAPLPLELAGHSVTVGGRAAPLFFVAGREEGGRVVGQINAQVPWQAPLDEATPVIVRRDSGGVTVESAPTNVRVARVSPAIFTFGGGAGAAAIVNLKVSPDDGVIDGSIAQPVGSIPGATTQPARRGGIISIYATGLGPVNPPARDGDHSLDALRRTATTSRVQIGGVEASVLFSGLAPQFVGLYQINVIVPSGAQSGDAVPVQVQIEGAQSRNDVTLAVQP